MRNTGDQRLVSGANCGRDILLSFAECSATLSWYLFFCAGKLSDVMYVPPWRIATGGGKELTVIGSIKSGAWHPKWRLACQSDS